jgi:hypothetical protein
MLFDKNFEEIIDWREVDWIQDEIICSDGEGQSMYLVWGEKDGIKYEGTGEYIIGVGLDVVTDIEIKK